MSRPGNSDRRRRAFVARVLRQCLEEGATVDIDGLGRFRRNQEGIYEFEAHARPRLFLAYAEEDLPLARRLYGDFVRRGLDPWLDKEKLLPGQNWPRAIDHAIELSDHFLACFSHKSLQKRGQFQAELRYALDCAERMPLDRVYFIPVRIEECEVPWRIRREIQYVDLFPNWERGFRRILSAMRQQEKKLRLAG